MNTKTILAISAMAVGFVADAAEFVIKDGTSDWTSAANFTDTSGGAVTTGPAAGDTVVVQQGCHVYVRDTDAASLALVKTLAKIVPNSSTSTIEFNITGSEEVEIDVPITAYGYGTYTKWVYWLGGPIVKTGSGTLHLSADDLMGSTWRLYNYYSSFRVDEGTLKLQQNHAGSTASLGVVEVKAGATFVPPYTSITPTSDRSMTYIQGLSGAGAIVADTSYRSDCEFTFYATGQNVIYTFSGTMTGVSRICFVSGSVTQRFSGNMNSENAWIFTNRAAYESPIRLGITNLGNPADSYGSLGRFGASTDVSIENGGNLTFEYIGNGGDVWKRGLNYVALYGTNCASFMLDSGNANFEWNGNLIRSHTSSYPMWTYLTGSNATASVISGSINDNFNTTANYAGHGLGMRLIKEGTGTWRISALTSSIMRNINDAIEIREGTLAIDSIANYGCPTSIGLQTNCTDGASVKKDEIAEHKVDYQFLMGAAKRDGIAAEARAYLEYSGTVNGFCDNRLMMLAGNGGLKNNSNSTAFKFRGVRGAANQNVEFYLSGTGTGENQVADIVDGEGGKVSVVKDGAGKWIISGTNSFSGNLVVTGGTLVVRNPAANTRHTWFRFTPTKLHNESEDDIKTEYSSASKHWMIEEIGVFDKDGNRAMFSVRASDQGTKSGNNTTQYYSAWRDLQPGEASIQTDGATVGNWGSYFGCIFDGQITGGSAGWTAHHYPLTLGETMLKSGVPASWFPIVMRLPSDFTAEITSYDYANIFPWYDHAKQTTEEQHRTANYRNSGLMQSYMFEGSVDGFVWEQLEFTNNVNCLCRTTANGLWTYDGWSCTTTPHKGFPVEAHAKANAYMLNNVASVRVGNGATLQMESGSTKVEIGALTIDANATAGTIDGFTLADEGTLTVENLGNKTVVPLNLSNIGATETCKFEDWSVKVGSKVSPNRHLVWEDGKLKVITDGLYIILE